jgi:hypothetical protein
MLLANSTGMRGVGNVLDTDPEDWRKVLSRAFSKPAALSVSDNPLFGCPE